MRNLIHISTRASVVKLVDCEQQIDFDRSSGVLNIQSSRVRSLGYCYAIRIFSCYHIALLIDFKAVVDFF